MAHQAHNIPWASLASNFGHTKSSNGVFDIRALDKPGQPKFLIHFAKTFATSLRQYAEAERRKYDTAEEYRTRARTWVRSDRTQDGGGNSDTSQTTLGEIETKKLYSDEDARLWRAQRREYPSRLGNSETQYIDNWIKGDEHWGGREKAWENLTTRDQWVTYWTDDWKTLIMESALVLTPLHQRQFKRNSQATRERMDTLFLLAHHPQIPLLSWTSECDSCCNIQSGLICIAEAALTGYIYFNLLFAMRKSGSDVCDPTEDSMPVDYWPLKYRPSLKPRPRYMNTPSWLRLLQQVCRYHDHHLQIMMFEPFLRPRKGENFTTLPLPTTSPQPEAAFCGRWDRDELSEVDVMLPAQDVDTNQDPLSIPGHHEALYEFLRGLWKLLVNFEMLWRDSGAPIDWEEMVVAQLEVCFRGTEGRPWTLFWEDRPQAIEYHASDLFVDGKVERSAEQQPCKKQYKKQKASNRAMRREAAREAKSHETS